MILAYLQYLEGMKMKKEIRNVTELTKAKTLLEKIEGGAGQYTLPTFELPLKKLPNCDFFECSVPMYGAITLPGWRLKK